jgi:hypothetical protein
MQNSLHEAFAKLIARVKTETERIDQRFAPLSSESLPATAPLPVQPPAVSSQPVVPQQVESSPLSPLPEPAQPPAQEEK